VACGILCASRKAEGEVGRVGAAFKSEEWMFDVEEECGDDHHLEYREKVQQRWEN